MRVGDRGLFSVPTPLSAGQSVGPRGASGEICSQRRTKCVKRTWFSMMATAYKVTVAMGALECPFGPSWRRKKARQQDSAHCMIESSRSLIFFFEREVSFSFFSPMQKLGPSSFKLGTKICTEDLESLYCGSQ